MQEELLTDEPLLVSPCFVALTRPATLLGVTIDYWMINLIVSSTVAIGASFLWLPPVALLLHFIGVIAYKIDPHIFQLLQGKLSCARCPNKRLWGCLSLEPW